MSLPGTSNDEPDAQEMMTFAMRWLAANPDLPLVERLPAAIVAASAGDRDVDCNVEDVALYLNATPLETFSAMGAAREHDEAEAFSYAVASDQHDRLWDHMHALRVQSGADTQEYQAARERVVAAAAELRQIARRMRSVQT